MDPQNILSPGIPPGFPPGSWRRWLQAGKVPLDGGIDCRAFSSITKLVIAASSGTLGLGLERPRSLVLNGPDVQRYISVTRLQCITDNLFNSRSCARASRLDYGQDVILPDELRKGIIAGISSTETRLGDILGGRVVLACCLYASAAVNIAKLDSRRLAIPFRWSPRLEVLDFEPLWKCAVCLRQEGVCEYFWECVGREGCRQRHGGSQKRYNPKHHVYGSEEILRVKREKEGQR